MLYRAPVYTSPVTEGVTLFKHQLLLLLFIYLRSFFSIVFLLFYGASLNINLCEMSSLYKDDDDDDDDDDDYY